MSDSLRTHESQHARPLCPSPTPGIYSNSCPSSRWCHLAISSSVAPFSSCPQSLPASGSFPMSQLFAWGGQSTGVSSSASMNTQRAWWTTDGGLWLCTRDRDQDHLHGKEMQKGKMVIWGGLTNSCEKKRSEKQRRKGKIFPFECRVPKNSKER